MNWDRVRVERLIARYGQADFRSDTRQQDFPEGVQREKQRVSLAGLKGAAREAAIGRFVDTMDEREFQEIEFRMERWIGVAPAAEISDLVEKLSSDERCFFQALLRKMTTRQNEWVLELKKLTTRWADKAKRNRKRKRKESLRRP